MDNSIIQLKLQLIRLILSLSLMIRIIVYKFSIAMVDILLNSEIKVRHSEIIQDPGGIAVDSSGNVYVGDGIDSDLHVFSPVK